MTGSGATGGDAAGGSGAATTGGSSGSSTGGAGGTVGGTGGSGAGAGGTGAAPATGGTTASGGSAGTAGMILPIDRGNGVFAYEFDGLVFEVDSNVGARVVTFALNGKNILTGTSAHPQNYGSTFTLSPQNAGGGAVGSGWPPPAGIDAQPYQVSVEGELLTMVSSPTTVQGGTVQVTKRFRPEITGGGIQVEYVIANAGASAVAWAPWEISRVLPDGITFFPTGASTGLLELPLQQSGGWTWWPYALSDIDDNPWGDKSQADGSAGWLAHAADGLLFLKRFDDLADASKAPGEAEISIYASKPGYQGQGAYVEIEPQGPFTTLQPQETIAWTVSWYLHELPVGAEPATGDPELVSFTQALVQ